MEEQPQQAMLSESNNKKYYNPIKTTFNGGFNNCLSFLHHRVLPKIGTISYQMDDWELFPMNKDQCKELAIKWAGSFQKREDFAGNTRQYLSCSKYKV